jgi:YfiR/HmsC-like
MKNSRSSPSSVAAALLLAVTALLAPISSARPEIVEADENVLKAAFIYNFIAFTQWPADRSTSNATYRICILGADRATQPITALQGKSIHDHALTVARIDTVVQARSCDLVYLESPDIRLRDQLIQTAAGKSILTVSSRIAFAEDGGMIEFVDVGDKVSFKINVDAVDHSRLRLSSKLLNLASIVHER